MRLTKSFFRTLTPAGTSKATDTDMCSIYRIPYGVHTSVHVPYDINVYAVKQDAATTCHSVYRDVLQESNITTMPPGQDRYFIANGSASTPAPIIAVVLWNALYHLCHISNAFHACGANNEQQPTRLILRLLLTCIERPITDQFVTSHS